MVTVLRVDPTGIPVFMQIQNSKQVSTMLSCAYRIQRNIFLDMPTISAFVRSEMLFDNKINHNWILYLPNTFMFGPVFFFHHSTKCAQSLSPAEQEFLRLKFQEYIPHHVNSCISPCQKQFIDKHSLQYNIKLCKEGRTELLIWLAKHLNYPYPTKHEKQLFALKLKIPIKSIAYWFINARVRYIPIMNNCINKLIKYSSNHHDDLIIPNTLPSKVVEVLRSRI